MVRIIVSIFVLWAMSIANAQPQALAKLENSTGGRLGVYAINTGNSKQVSYRADERFPLCSTSKVMSVAAILKKSEAYKNFLQQKINYQQSELVIWSPVTEKHFGTGMTIAELSRAAITISDNTAINLLMKQLGGPQSVTDFARTIGDKTFKLDRFEPQLNMITPGDIRDTSTPRAMAMSLRQLVLGNVLAPAQRELLKTWLIENTTGDSRIRASIPSGWIVADKTGSCGHYGTTHDIAVIWPKGGMPIVIAIYFMQSKENAMSNENVIAKATEIVLSLFPSL